MTEEQKAALAARVLSGLEELAGMAYAFDDGVANALVNVAVLLRGGQRDKIVELLTTPELNEEAIAIVMQAMANVGLELGPTIVQ